MLARLPARVVAVPALLLCAVPVAAAAQSIDYGNVTGSDETSQSGSAGSGIDSGRFSRGGRGGSGKIVDVTPYIEARQIVTAELTPGNDVLTYSVIAAGVDAEVVGKRNAASVSLRYERRFGWSDSAEDGDVISGLARGYATVMPGLQIEAGGLATRTSIDNSGASFIGGLRNDDTVTQVYSVYAGPSVSTHAGDVAVSANYRFGYTRVETPDAIVTATDVPAVDIFEDSTIHAADVHAGVQPDVILPVGLGAGAGYVREDISNLDQRVEDFHARGDVTVPVSRTLALVGGLGYEDVEISSRDVLRDGDGNAIIGSDGRFVTDRSLPRYIAYDVSGLIWDAGVLWRPSPRTSLEAHVGRRYGATSVHGTFAYRPTPRSSVNISVYDNVAGFGGRLTDALADLPTEFTVVRNPLSGDISGCVDTLDSESVNCLPGVFGSLRSATFRGRGVAATYALRFNRISTGVGAGYDRRKFIAAPGTILASSNGVIDEDYWIVAYLNGSIDSRSGYSANLYANWFESGSGSTGDLTAMGASASYYRFLTRRLSASAAVGIDGANRREPLDDVWGASAQVGVRYSF